MIEALRHKIEIARQREQADDHLSDDERSALVREYSHARPEIILPKDVSEAFVEIVFPLAGVK